MEKQHYLWNNAVATIQHIPGQEEQGTWKLFSNCHLPEMEKKENTWSKKQNNDIDEFIYNFIF